MCVPETLLSTRLLQCSVFTTLLFFNQKQSLDLISLPPRNCLIIGLTPLIQTESEYVVGNSLQNLWKWTFMTHSKLTIGSSRTMNSYYACSYTIQINSTLLHWNVIQMQTEYEFTEREQLCVSWWKNPSKMCVMDTKQNVIFHAY